MKKYIILFFAIMSNFSSAYSQSMQDAGLFLTLPYDLEVELQRWSRGWVFDSYIKGTVELVEWHPASW
jgi:hypothetical protein